MRVPGSRVGRPQGVGSEGPGEESSDVEGVTVQTSGWRACGNIHRLLEDEAPKGQPGVSGSSQVSRFLLTPSRAASHERG